MAIFYAILAGFLFGIVLQRSYFCMYQGLVNGFLNKDYRIIRGSILAVILIMIGFHLLASLGVIKLAPAPLFWGADIIGGVIFGIGMYLAGSCMGGVPMRAASGLIGWFATLLGIAIGGWWIIFGWLKPIRESLWKATEITINGNPPTLASIFGVNPWITVLIMTVVLGLIYIKLKELEVSQSSETERQESKGISNLWGPIKIGMGLAVVEWIAFAGGKTATGWEMVPGSSSILRGILGQGFGWEQMSWPITVVLATLAGVFVSALIFKEFKVRMPSWQQAIRLFVGGLCLSIGAVTASGGCNMAHTFGFLPQLSLSSFLVLACMFGTTALIIKLKFTREVE
jgi:hypothetical protein